MSNILKISEAASLALHGAALIAKRPGELVSTKEIASELHVSEAHLSKVLQRLSKAGIVKAIRGPKGGFTLGKPASEISLIDIYESIEGSMESNRCLLDYNICDGNGCILGEFLRRADRQFVDYMAGTKLNELFIHIKGEKNGHSEGNNKD